MKGGVGQYTWGQISTHRHFNTLQICRAAALATASRKQRRPAREHSVQQLLQMPGRAVPTFEQVVVVLLPVHSEEKEGKNEGQPCVVRKQEFPSQISPASSKLRLRCSSKFVVEIRGICAVPVCVKNNVILVF